VPFDLSAFGRAVTQQCQISDDPEQCTLELVQNDFSGAKRWMVQNDDVAFRRTELKDFDAQKIFQETEAGKDIYRRIAEPRPVEEEKKLVLVLGGAGTGKSTANKKSTGSIQARRKLYRSEY
jgi:hypothetical protein